LRAAAAILAAAAALGVAGAAVAHAVLARGTTLRLPELHGQMTWAAGARRAPVSVRRGHTAVVAYVAPACSACRAELRFVLGRLPVRLRPDVVQVTTRGRSLLLLVDRSGHVRTGYAFPFAPAFVEGDLRTLAG
jgi:hypothetical protein